MGHEKVRALYTILLVEDNHGEQQLVKKALKDAGVDTNLVISHNAEDTFLFLEKSLPHLIILDLNLPGKNGLEILQEIKQNKVYLEIPVIMFSSAKEIRDDKLVLSDAYIVKPSSLEEYFRVILAMDQYGRNMLKDPENKIQHLKNLKDSGSVL